MIAPASYEAPSAVGHRFDHVAVAYVAGKGRRAEENQDSFWPRVPGEARRPVVDYLVAGRLYVVTDGVSQGLRPQEASRLAADTIGQEYYRLTDGWSLGRDLTVPLREAVLAAHRALVTRSDQVRQQRDTAGVDMQSTCVCLLLLGDFYYTAHVGDSRAYLWREGKLYSLTEDHADAEGRVNRLLGAELTPEQVTVTPHATSGPGPLRLGDCLLLCSDGVHRFLSDHRINEILNRREGLASMAGALVEAVYERGLGREDDIALILIGIDYDPRQLAEKEAQSASLRMARQWREAITLAEEVAWWQPGAGASLRPVLRSLADLYVEAGCSTLERDEALGLKMLENAARLGSAQGERYHRLAERYLDAASRWRLWRGQEKPSPEKEQAVKDLLAIAGQAAALFGPGALAMAYDAALNLGEELYHTERAWDALPYVAWAADHADGCEGHKQQAQALAVEIRKRLLARQKDDLQRAWQAMQAHWPQDVAELVRLWQQACRALLAATDAQYEDLAWQVAEAQQQLYEKLSVSGHWQKLDAMYAMDAALLWDELRPSFLRTGQPDWFRLPDEGRAGIEGTRPLSNSARVG